MQGTGKYVRGMEAEDDCFDRFLSEWNRFRTFGSIYFQDMLDRPNGKSLGCKDDEQESVI